MGLLVKNLKRKLKALNPNPRAMFRLDTRQQQFRAERWVAWLKDHPRYDEVMKDLVEQERAYHKKWTTINLNYLIILEK